MGDRQVVVTGPNHALHFVLTLLTFWACGGWAWVWLFVALMNRRRVDVYDGQGRPVPSDLTPVKVVTVIAAVILLMIIISALV